MTKVSKKSYDSSNIKTLQFPENVRQKPTLYIGPIDERGILTILREVADNIVDEALAGRATSCDIFMCKPEGSKMVGFFVLDDGEGIPVKPMKIKNIDGTEIKIPAIKAILSMMHTSGKFNDESYAASRGSHGLGIKASNALSKVYHVWTFRDDKWWEISFKKGLIKTELRACPAPEHPGTGKALKRGTLVYFEPDSDIFTAMQDRSLQSMFDAKSATLTYLLEWCRLASYFTQGLTLRVHHYTGNTKEFFSENGPADFIKRRLALLNKAAEKEGEEVALLRDDAEFTFQDSLVECVVAFTNADGSNLDAFTNGLRNVEGGVHVDAFLGSLKTSLAEFAPKKSLYTVRELREGLVALVNVKLSAPSFDSQTKEKLVDDRAGKPVQELLTTALTSFFKKHKALALAICERANNIHALKSRFTASKKVINSLRNVAKKGLPVKASLAPNCKAHERELYIIEGDSASGTCKSARDAYYQESLPIKGKVMNCFSGDTLLLKADGTTARIDSLVDAWVGVGFDINKGIKSIDEMSASWEARLVTDTVTLTFADGLEVECTPDHLFLTQRGYIAAAYLLDTDDVVQVDTDPNVLPKVIK